MFKAIINYIKNLFTKAITFRLAHSKMADCSGRTHEAEYTRNMYAPGSMKDPTVYTWKNYITEETFVGTARQLAEYSVKIGLHTEIKNVNTTQVLAGKSKHTKGWLLDQ